jgi:hypothetical protein
VKAGNNRGRALLAVGQRTQLEPQGLEWQSVLQTTGQPASLVGTR